MKRQTVPLVSVIMPVYNGSLFVEKAITSILTQTYPRFELLVVDDASTDNTWKILRKLKNANPEKMRIFRFKKNSGESAAANFAFTKVRGQFVARMDADDVSHKTRLEKQIKYIMAYPDVVVLGSQAHVIDSRGHRIGEKNAPLTHETIYNRFAYINPMIHPSVMYNKRLLPNRPYLYHSTFESTDDYHTYFELFNYGRFANLPDRLLSYRIHGHNKSLTHMKEKFWTDTQVRLTAISRFNYRAPIFMFPVIVAQAITVFVLPESILREVFFYLRGLKRPQGSIRRFVSGLLPSTIKRYAVSVR